MDTFWVFSLTGGEFLFSNFSVWDKDRFCCCASFPKSSICRFSSIFLKNQSKKTVVRNFTRCQPKGREERDRTCRPCGCPGRSVLEGRHNTRGTGSAHCLCLATSHLPHHSQPLRALVGGGADLQNRARGTTTHRFVD